MLVFGPGRSTSQCLDINIVDDNIDEGPESFSLVCVYERSTGDGMTETVTVTANVIIIDNGTNTFSSSSTSTLALYIQ